MVTTWNFEQLQVSIEQNLQNALNTYGKYINREEIFHITQSILNSIAQVPWPRVCGCVWLNRPTLVTGRCVTKTEVHRQNPSCQSMTGHHKLKSIHTVLTNCKHPYGYVAMFCWKTEQHILILYFVRHGLPAPKSTTLILSDGVNEINEPTLNKAEGEVSSVSPFQVQPLSSHNSIGYKICSPSPKVTVTFKHVN